MEKCVSCNGTLAKGETRCFLCGAAVPPLRHKATLNDRFRTFLKISFILSAALTVASLFFDFTPSFMKCIVATLTLMLVKSSADQMSES